MKYFLDIRTQLNEQLRCLDTRLDCQQSQLIEIQVTMKYFWISAKNICLQDVFKRRAEIELNYSRDLEKLSKLLTSRHKEQKLKVTFLISFIRLTLMGHNESYLEIIAASIRRILLLIWASFHLLKCHQHIN